MAHLRHTMGKNKCKKINRKKLQKKLQNPSILHNFAPSEKKLHTNLGEKSILQTGFQPFY